MYKPEYGDPVVCVRLPKSMIAAAKMAAKQHDTTLSGLVRSLLDDRLQQDGIDWSRSSEPTPGQQTLDDV